VEDRQNGARKTNRFVDGTAHMRLAEPGVNPLEKSGSGGQKSPPPVDPIWGLGTPVQGPEDRLSRPAAEAPWAIGSSKGCRVSTGGLSWLEPP
jgi:hypothetical protein